jgi:malate:Na+ symporter
MKSEQAVVNDQGKSSRLEKICTYTIGVIPLPLYLILSVIIYTASVYGRLPADMIGGFAMLMILGIFLGDVGIKVPILKDIGGPAILCMFVPSAMVFYNVFNPAAMKAMTAIMKTSNFLYFYISCLITGSILGMHRQVLIQGFLRLFVPIVVGTLGSVIVGVAVGMVMGFGAHHTFFYIVMPIVSGGIGEGILPLSMAYSEILNLPYEKLIPQFVPAAMLGNVVAIMTAGYLRKLGDRKPHLTGNGMLVKTGDEAFLKAVRESNNQPVDFPIMGAGLLLACSFFIFGQLANVFIAIPAAIIMIFSAAIVKALNIMPAKMEQGAYHMYKFIAGSLTWALMVGLGVLYTPWGDVVSALTPAYAVTVAATVLSMIAAGFYVGEYMNMYPIEAAIVTACHSGLGGTGDVAILSASNRMEMMPFAQVATRLGGACMVVIAAILLRIWQ